MKFKWGWRPNRSPDLSEVSGIMTSMDKMTDHDRELLEQKYGKMTDKFWHILLSETEEAETEEELIEIITDVYTYAEEHEKDYEFWEALKTSDKSPESIAKLLDKGE